MCEQCENALEDERDTARIALRNALDWIDVIIAHYGKDDSSMDLENTRLALDYVSPYWYKR